MVRVLYLEDDPIIGKALSGELAHEAFEVSWVKTIADARRSLAASAFDLVLLDVNLPDGTSYDLCREIKAEHPALAVLFVTAKTDEESAIKGLSLGAVDYIRKPFSRRELILRLKSHVKNKSGRVVGGGIEVDLDKHQATFDGRPLTLRPKEFELLSMLVRRFGESIPRETILQEIDSETAMNDTTLSSHVSRLRSKLKDIGAENVQIVPVYGNGYRIEKRK